jgi:hypothetical protein
VWINKTQCVQWSFWFYPFSLRIVPTTLLVNTTVATKIRCLQFVRKPLILRECRWRREEALCYLQHAENFHSQWSEAYGNCELHFDLKDSEICFENVSSLLSSNKLHRTVLSLSKPKQADLSTYMQTCCWFVSAAVFPTLKQNLTQILCSFTGSILNVTTHWL